MRPANDTKLRRELRELLEQARKDTLIFAVLTVLMTPFLVGIVGIMVVMGAMMLSTRHLSIESVQGVLIFTVLFLVIALWNSWRSGDEHPWSAAVLIVVVGLLVAVGPRDWLPERLHLGLCGSLSFVSLALMGRAYEPRDDYDLGTHRGVQSLSSVGDVAHLGSGCLVAIPALVLNAFGEIFASSWIWRGVTDAIVGDSERLLVAVKQGDLARVVGRMGQAGHKILHMMKRAQLLRIYGGKVTLTEKARELLE